jgi:hypothetical protein
MRQLNADAAERCFALGFALEQMRQNVKEPVSKVLEP